MHILGLETVYLAQKYIFSVIICLFAYLFCAEYMQMYANIFKCMLYCTSMLPPIRRVALDSCAEN